MEQQVLQKESEYYNTALSLINEQIKQFISCNGLRKAKIHLEYLSDSKIYLYPGLKKYDIITLWRENIEAFTEFLKKRQTTKSYLDELF